PLHLRKITTWNNSWRLVIDTTLESINKLNGTLGLDGCNSSIHILGNYITSVHKAASHVLAMARITLGHHRNYGVNKANRRNLS
ncbi:hypothetical protein CISIN_1g042151mg, partial [Citrus sinensis]